MFVRSFVRSSSPEVSTFETSQFSKTLLAFLRHIPEVKKITTTKKKVGEKSERSSMRAARMIERSRGLPSGTKRMHNWGKVTEKNMETKGGESRVEVEEEETWNRVEEGIVAKNNERDTVDASFGEMLERPECTSSLPVIVNVVEDRGDPNRDEDLCLDADTDTSRPTTVSSFNDEETLDNQEEVTPDFTDSENCNNIQIIDAKEESGRDSNVCLGMVASPAQNGKTTELPLLSQQNSVALETKNLNVAKVKRKKKMDPTKFCRDMRGADTISKNYGTGGTVRA